jgi:hypothetical protein
VGSPAPEGVDVGYPPDQRIQAVDKLGFRAFLEAERLKVIARLDTSCDRESQLEASSEGN